MLSRLYGILRKTTESGKARGQAGRMPGRRALKYKVYLIILTVILILYQVGAVVTALLMPGMLLRAGISAGYLLTFIIFSIFAVIMSLFMVFFYRLARQMKENVQDLYRCSVLNLSRYISLAVLFLSGALYIAGLNQAFTLKRWVLNSIPDFNGISPVFPFAAFGGFILICSGAFVFFILRRSAYSLRQYLLVFLLTCIVMFLYALFIPGEILDWNNSILTRTQLLSWDYGFLGWIIIILTVLALFYTGASAVMLRLNEYFIQSSKAKGLSLVNLKLGYICLMLAAVVLVLPQMMNIF